MAQVIFRKNLRENTLEPKLVIGYMTTDGDQEEKELPFSCGEDLQEYMKAILKKDYTGFFSERECRFVTDVWLKGISIIGQNEQGRVAVHVLDGYVQGSNIIYEEVLRDENALKLKQISDIIKQ